MPHAMPSSEVTLGHDEFDYLAYPCRLVPEQKFGHGMIYEYQIPLPAGRVAVLRLVAAKGWDLIVRSATGPEVPRGLFASPRDALLLLAAEVRSSAMATTAVRSASIVDGVDSRSAETIPDLTQSGIASELRIPPR